MATAILVTTRSQGRPNLGDADETARVRVPGTRQAFTNEASGFLSMLSIGTVPQGEVFWLSGDAERIAQLQGRGGNITLPQNTIPVPLINAIRNAGIDAIVRQSDGQRVGLWPPIVVAGADPLTEGLNAVPDPDEVYVRSPL